MEMNSIHCVSETAKEYAFDRFEEIREFGQEIVAHPVLTAASIAFFHLLGKTKFGKGLNLFLAAASSVAAGAYLAQDRWETLMGKKEGGKHDLLAILTIVGGFTSFGLLVRQTSQWFHQGPGLLFLTTQQGISFSLFANAAQQTLAVGSNSGAITIGLALPHFTAPIRMSGTPSVKPISEKLRIALQSLREKIAVQRRTRNTQNTILDQGPIVGQQDLELLRDVARLERVVEEQDLAGARRLAREITVKGYPKEKLTDEYIGGLKLRVHPPSKTATADPYHELLELRDVQFLSELKHVEEAAAHGKILEARILFEKALLQYSGDGLPSSLIRNALPVDWATRPLQENLKTLDILLETLEDSFHFRQELHAAFHYSSGVEALAVGPNTRAFLATIRRAVRVAPSYLEGEERDMPYRLLSPSLKAASTELQGIANNEGILDLVRVVDRSVTDLFLAAHPWGTMFQECRTMAQTSLEPRFLERVLTTFDRITDLMAAGQKGKVRSAIHRLIEECDRATAHELSRKLEALLALTQSA